MEEKLFTRYMFCFVLSCDLIPNTFYHSSFRSNFFSLCHGSYLRSQSSPISKYDDRKHSRLNVKFDDESLEMTLITHKFQNSNPSLWLYKDIRSLIINKNLIPSFDLWSPLEYRIQSQRSRNVSGSIKYSWIFIKCHDFLILMLRLFIFNCLFRVEQ